MFTGIIESEARVVKSDTKGSNRTFTLKSNLSSEFRVDQSVSHNGVCLTIEDIHGDMYEVTAIQETLTKSNLGSLKVGDVVNLERCLIANGRFDGHIVQGHVDQTGILEAIEALDGSYVLTFSYDSRSGNITVEKGSICINGVSLTVFNSTDNRFSVALIPYTWNHTNLSKLKIGDRVNLEFDILGKYMQRIMQKQLKNQK